MQEFQQWFCQHFIQWIERHSSRGTNWHITSTNSLYLSILWHSLKIRTVPPANCYSLLSVSAVKHYEVQRHKQALQPRSLSMNITIKITTAGRGNNVCYGIWKLITVGFYDTFQTCLILRFSSVLSFRVGIVNKN